MQKTIPPADPAEKRGKPDMTGTPGTAILLGEDLQFRWRKKSPYDALLNQLAINTDAWKERAKNGEPRPGLRFDSVKAKTAVYSRAKRLGFMVGFAEKDGKLFVRFEGRKSDDVREARRAAIRKLLATGAQESFVQIANKLRNGGDTNLDAATVDVIMIQMMKKGEVIRQEGGSWKLSSKKA